MTRLYIKVSVNLRIGLEGGSEVYREQETSKQRESSVKSERALH